MAAPKSTVSEKRMRAALAQKGISAIQPGSGMDTLLGTRHESEDADPHDIPLVAKVEEWRSANQSQLTQPHKAADGSAANKILVCVRKRPVLGSLGEEVSNMNFDCVSCFNPCTYLHGKEDKLGLFTGNITADRKEFDHTFGAGDDNGAVYRSVVRPLVDEVLTGGICTVLAFGQTGSGKTFTQTYMQEKAARDIFQSAPAGTQVLVSFFENQGDLNLDLLAARKPMVLRTDAGGHVNVVGLTEIAASSAAEAVALVQQGAAERATAATGNNPHVTGNMCYVGALSVGMASEGN